MRKNNSISIPCRSQMFLNANYLHCELKSDSISLILLLSN